MKAEIHCDGNSISLNPFVNGLVSNVARALIESLKLEKPPEKRVEFTLCGEETALTVDGRPVSLGLTTGFAARLVGETLRGMLRPLKGAQDAREVRITVELD